MAASRRLGLALSGGGFRAAAFHLGVLKGLRRLGRLEELSALSGVSGGALLAAAYVADGLGDFDAFEARMHAFLSRDLKPRIVAAALRPDRSLRLLLDPAYSLTEVMAEVLDRDVFRGATLGGLSGRSPRLTLNATCVNHGTGWRFRPDRIGDWRLATRDKAVLASFPLARAVAASAAFPGGFAPLVLRGRLFAGSARPPREVLLTDGGVDDNLGVQALVADECDEIVVSDGSFPYARDDRPLDRFGLLAVRRTAVLALVALAAGWALLRPAPGAFLAAVVLALAVPLLLRLRLAVSLFGGVMLRGQRRGLLRHAFAGRQGRPVRYLGLASALSQEGERRLGARGVRVERLRRLGTDLALAPADVDGLVALGEALALERLSA